MLPILSLLFNIPRKALHPCYTSGSDMGQLRLGRAVWQWGPVLSHWQEEKQGEDSLLSSRWAGLGTQSLLSLSLGVLSCAQTAIWNVLCENTWGAPPLSTSDFHKQRSQKKKVLWVLNKNLLNMFFHWSAKQCALPLTPLSPFIQGDFRNYSVL